MKKRIFALLLAAVMLMNTFPAHALEGHHNHTHTHNQEGPTFVVETVTAAPGETVDVAICLVNNPGITSIKLEVEYDDALTLQSVTPNADLGSNFLKSPDGRYPVILNWYDGLNDITGDWDFAVLHFQVAEDAAPGSYAVSISFDPNDIFDANEDNLDFGIENGGVVVEAEGEEPVPGDAAFVVDTVTAAPGETVDVAIRLRNNPGITSIKLSVEHPGGVDGISLVSVTPNPDLGSNFLKSPDGVYPMILNWYDGLNNVTGDWIFATLRFSIPANISAFTYPITVTFNPDDVYDVDENNVDFVVENGAIVVEGSGECNHSYLPLITEPTCLEGGYTTYTCVYCGDSYVADETAALGHDLGEWTVVTPAGCETDGLERRTCSRCDYVEENVLPAIGHNYEAVVTAPTCVEGGYTTYTCSNCGDSYVADETAALGHEWDEGVVTVEPTEETAGVRLHTCGRCGATEERPIAPIIHEHEYESVVTAPTCTEQGYTTHTCRCGDSYVDSYTDALGHDLGEWTVITPAGCETDGLERRTCSRCDYVEENVLPAIGHNYEAVVTAPTCVDGGYTTYTCSNCGDSYVADETAALGHEWDEGIVTLEPTEETAGVRLHTCVRCGATEERPIAPIIHEHEYESVVTAPTCTEQGYTTHTCRCGDSYVDSYTDALGHGLGEWTVVTPAGCETDGLERRTCSRCDYVEENILPAIGHNYEAVVTAPTCVDGGYTTYTCSNCGDSYVADETAALGHEWDEGIVTLEPTEETAGVRLHTCVRCGATEERPIAPIDHEHAYESVVTAPTCTEQGYTTHTCRCGDSYVDSYTDALGHNMSQWAVTVAPGCETAGLEITECVRDGCDYEETREVAPLGHNYEAVVTAPTCVDGGYTTYTCSNCGDSYVADETAALGHEWDEGVVTVEPTEATAGVRLHTCVRCGATEERPIAPIDHEHAYQSVVTEPTCTEQGYTTHTCHCGDSYVDSYTDALGHDLGEWTVITPAGCTTEGKVLRTCSRCGYSEEDVIEPTGHNYEAVVTEPTCEENGYTTYTCSNCGDSYVADETAALGHEWDEGVVTVEPTEATAGVRLHTCVRCGATEERPIAPIDHEHAYESVVTAPTCTEQGYTTHTCRCGDSYIDNYTDALGHEMDEWTVITPAGCVTEGLAMRTCSRCGESEETVLPAVGHQWVQGEDELVCTVCGEVMQGYPVTLSTEQTGAISSVWVDGVEYPAVPAGDGYTVNLPSTEATNLVIYSMHVGDEADVHTQYPVGMKVWMLKYENGTYTATYVPEFDNLLQYAGSSIRIVGNKGIRMITAIDKSVKKALTSANGLAGYTLLEYGTALSWAADIVPGVGLTLGQEYTKSNYAYKKGVADPVFKNTATQIQYTNVLVGFDNDQCIPDIAMRPYMIVQDAEGNQITIYGGVIYRSIGYIAYQNRAAFAPKTAAYEYVWAIIHHVYGDQYDAEYKN